MAKKQKPKRSKPYNPKYKGRGFKPKKGLDLTSKNMEKLLKEYYSYISGEYRPKKESDINLFEGWKTLTYSKNSDKFKNGEKFLKWFNYYRSKNIKIYTFDRDNFKEYCIKNCEHKQLKEDLWTILVEMKERIGKKESKQYYYNFTNFTKEESGMVVYNSKKIAFQLESEIIEKEKTVIKEKRIFEKINSDKTEKFKQKIQKMLKSKVFEKAYLSSKEELIELILKTIKI